MSPGERMRSGCNAAHSDSAFANGRQCRSAHTAIVIDTGAGMVYSVIFKAYSFAARCSTLYYSTDGAKRERHFVNTVPQCIEARSERGQLPMKTARRMLFL